MRMISAGAAAVIVVGAGGIGSCLFQDLCRFLPRTIDLHLMDRDVVEGKNLHRQHFSRQDLGRNKAEALAEKAVVAVGLDRVYFHPHYLTSPAQLARIAGQYRQVVLVGAVDNHPARRVMERFVRRSEQPVYCIDCANAERRGEVVAVYGGRAGVAGSFRSELDPSVLTDDAGDPTAVSCARRLDEGSIQMLYANRKAAIIALELAVDFLGGRPPKVGVVYFRDCQVARVAEAVRWT